MIRNVAIAGLLGVALLFTAACGGSDDPTPATSSDSSSAPSSSSGSGSTAPSGVLPGNVAGVFGLSDCFEAAMAVSTAMGLAFGMSGMGGEDLKGLDEEFRRARDAAPDQIARDLDTLAEIFREIGLEIEKSGWKPDGNQVPPASVMAAFQAFDSEAFNKAAERVGDWFDNSCAN